MSAERSGTYPPQALSGLDAGFVHLEDESAPMTIGALCEFEADSPRASPPTIEELRTRVAGNAARVAALRRRLVRSPLGAPMWIEGFDIAVEEHVAEYSVSSLRARRQLSDLVAERIATPLPRHRPLWSLDLIRHPRTRRRFFMLFRVHHAIADGDTAERLLRTLLHESGPRQTDSSTPLASATPFLDMLYADVRNRLRGARGLARSGAEEFGGLVNDQNDEDADEAPIGRVARRLRSLLPSGAAASLSGRIGTERRFRWFSLEATELDPIVRRFGCTYGDVFLSLVGSWLHRHQSQLHYPESGAGLRALVPIGLRNRAEDSTDGNLVGGAVVDLFLDEADPRSRLEGIAAQMQRYRTSGRAGSQAHRLWQIALDAGSATGPQLSREFLHQLNERCPFSVVVSTMRSGKQPMRYSAHTMVAAYPIVPVFHHLPVSFGAYRLEARLHVGMNCDPGAAHWVGNVASAFTRAIRALRIQS